MACCRRRRASVNSGKTERKRGERERWRREGGEERQARVSARPWRLCRGREQVGAGPRGGGRRAALCFRRGATVTMTKAGPGRQRGERERGASGLRALAAGLAGS